MSLAKCYLRRQIPKVITLEGITGDREYCHCSGAESCGLLAKEKHSHPEAVQTGFPRMVNIYTAIFLADIWQ